MIHTYNKYIVVKVVAMHDDKVEKLKATVMRHIRGEEAIVIAENIMSICDPERNHHKLISEITDHRKSNKSLTGLDGFITTKSDRKVPKRSTVGSKLLVE